MAERPPTQRQPGATERITVMLPPLVAAALRQEAARRHVSLGTVVTGCLAMCLDVEASHE